MSTTLLNLNALEAATPMYRLLSFARLCEHFETRKMVLVRPDKWDDPFENYLAAAEYRHGTSVVVRGQRGRVYGSCWTRRGSSDAMWRIYSPDKTSVRIKTTPKRLATCLDAGLARRLTASAYIGKVEYLPERDVVKTARDRALALYRSSGPDALASAFLFKRTPFSHESEVRVLVVEGSGRAGTGGLLQIPIDPHDLIETVLVDPRAPDTIVKMYRSHLKSAYGFRRHVAKSTLYRSPAQLVIDLGKR